MISTAFKHYVILFFIGIGVYILVSFLFDLNGIVELILAMVINFYIGFHFDKIKATFLRYKSKQKPIVKSIKPNIELSKLIGLEKAKENISYIINAIKIEKLRDCHPIAGHYIFQGNPGTGKTTVARILGQKFKELGLLSSGHFIEVKREDLVGEYQGHTAIKTKNILNQALGGVLFIDEIYALQNGDKDDFGKEAINTIVPFMEDYRDQFILIVAGYTHPMAEFLDANVGLKSRFNHTIQFDDYDSIQMYQIFKLMAKNFKWNDEVNRVIKNYFFEIVKDKEQHFGNARDVRKVLEKIKKEQINRLVKYSDLYKGDMRLSIFTLDDVKCLAK